METNIQDQQAISGELINMVSSEQNSDLPVINETAESGEPMPGRRKYHSSAMYAANAWRSTMKHHRQNQNHTGLNL